jgi:hypothetical protein
VEEPLICRVLLLRKPIYYKATPGNIWLGKYMKVAHCSARYLSCAENCSNDRNRLRLSSQYHSALCVPIKGKKGTVCGKARLESCRHCAMCNVHCAMCTVQCARCIVQCQMCILWRSFGDQPVKLYGSPLKRLNNKHFISI